MYYNYRKKAQEQYWQVFKGRVATFAYALRKLPAISNSSTHDACVASAFWTAVQWCLRVFIQRAPLQGIRNEPAFRDTMIQGPEARKEPRRLVLITLSTGVPSCQHLRIKALIIGTTYYSLLHYTILGWTLLEYIKLHHDLLHYNLPYVNPVSQRGPQSETHFPGGPGQLSGYCRGHEAERPKAQIPHIQDQDYSDHFYQRCLLL